MNRIRSVKHDCCASKQFICHDLPDAASLAIFPRHLRRKSRNQKLSTVQNTSINLNLEFNYLRGFPNLMASSCDPNNNPYRAIW